MSDGRRVLLDWEDGVSTWVVLGADGQQVGTVLGQTPEPPARGLNRARLLAAARKAIEADRAFLALSTPTTAQALAQVRALTRQTLGLLRLATDMLEDEEQSE